MKPPALPFTAVVLAADRGPDDPVARAAAVCCKALAPVCGRPMVLRVLDALAEAREVGTRILAGPERACVAGNAELDSLVGSGRVLWRSPQATPSSSAFGILQTLPDDVPVVVTTADHALLTAAMVDHFCAAARASGCDVVAGVARHDLVAAAFPGTRRTVTRLRDGGYCGCNLFAFLTPQARLAADFWRRVEQERKKPLRIVRVMGWVAVLRYLSGRLSLDQALAGLSRRMGLQAGVVTMPFAEAAVDVDKVEDWLLAERLLAAKDSGASG
jgi:CTP:molybdopterin cytidylyltransferase MocA